MVQYCIEVTLAWTVFYLVYLLFLRRETFFRANRWYLLHTLWIGALLPYLRKLPISFSTSDNVIYESVHYLNQGTQVVVSSVMSQPSSGLDLSAIFFGLYLLGVAMTSLRLMLGLRKIAALYRRGLKEKRDTYTLVTTDTFHLPFSFFKCVFLHSSFLEDESLKEIINHELKHISDLHTLDVILTEIIAIVFWWNPLVYLYKREIKQNHEFIADAYASQDMTTKNYGQILLGHSSSGIELALTHQFFNSHLKKRIIMLYTTKSARYKLSKYLVVLPCFFFLALLFSSNTLLSENESELISSEETEETVALDETIRLAESDLIEIRATATSSALKDTTPTTEAKDMGKASDQATHALDPILSNTDEIYKVVEEMPRFPGCEETDLSPSEKHTCANGKLLEFVYNNLKYPAAARKNGTEGMVVAQFVVNEDGTISDSKIVRSISDDCDASVLEMLSQMNKTEKWAPGKQNGKSVKILYTIPVRFKLQNDEPKEIDSSKPDHTERIKSFLKSVDETDKDSDCKDRVILLDGEEIESLKVLNDIEYENFIILQGDLPKELSKYSGRCPIIVITSKGKESIISTPPAPPQAPSAPPSPLAEEDSKSDSKDTLVFIDGLQMIHISSVHEALSSINPEDIKEISIYKNDIPKELTKLKKGHMNIVVVTKNDAPKVKEKQSESENITPTTMDLKPDVTSEKEETEIEEVISEHSPEKAALTIIENPVQNGILKFS